jgi:hypothetical protein
MPEQMQVQQQQEEEEEEEEKEEKEEEEEEEEEKEEEMAPQPMQGQQHGGDDEEEEEDDPVFGSAQGDASDDEVDLNENETDATVVEPFERHPNERALQELRQRLEAARAGDKGKGRLRDARGGMEMEQAAMGGGGGEGARPLSHPSEMSIEDPQVNISRTEQPPAKLPIAIRKVRDSLAVRVV